MKSREEGSKYFRPSREDFLKWIYKRNEDKNPAGPLAIYDFLCPALAAPAAPVVVELPSKDAHWRNFRDKALEAWPKGGSEFWLQGAEWAYDYFHTRVNGSAATVDASTIKAVREALDVFDSIVTVYDQKNNFQHSDIYHCVTTQTAIMRAKIDSVLGGVKDDEQNAVLDGTAVASTVVSERSEDKETE
jgi:hypothetical protein